MTITTVFDPPLPSDSVEVFNTKAFAAWGSLNTWSGEANATAATINDQVTDPGVVAIGADLVGANTIGDVAAIALDVVAVAAIDTDVSVVAAIAADVTAVAANEANINAAVADLPALAAKVSKTGDTMTGHLEVPAGASGAQVPQAQEVALLASTQIGISNVLINATGQIAQEALGSRTDDTYAEDGWIVLTQTAAVTASTVTDAEDGTPFMMRLAQAQATPQRMGRLQIIEASRSKPCRGQTYTARFGRVRCSAAETVRYALLAWTGTANVVTSDVVNNWTSGTYTPGNFFLASNLSVIATGSHAIAANTLTDGVSLTGVVPSGCNNLILFSWTDAAVAQNVTLDLAKARINHGSVATPYKHEDNAEELLACSRFKVPMDNRRPMGQAISATAVTSVSVVVPVPMFVLPSISASSHSFTGSAGTGIAGFTVSVTNMVLNSVRLDASGGSGLAAGNATVMVPAANTWLLAQL